MLSVHAEGAQVYECKAGADGKLAWAFREPIATLLVDGKTIGRHYAGPNWEHIDGSAVVGKVTGNAPGATAERYRLAEAASGRLARQRRLDRRHHRAADQHQGRQVGRRLRQGRHLQVRALLGGVRVPEEGVTIFARGKNDRR